MGIDEAYCGEIVSLSKGDGDDGDIVPLPYELRSWQGIRKPRDAKSFNRPSVQFAVFDAHITTNLDSKSIGDEGEQACNRASAGRLTWAYSSQQNDSSRCVIDVAVYAGLPSVRNPRSSPRGKGNCRCHAASCTRCRPAPPSPSLRSRCLTAGVADLATTD